MSAPTLAVRKFASCDGCQLNLPDCEDELLTLTEQVQISTFLEASSAVVSGPYDVSLVEGSITTRRRAAHPGDSGTVQGAGHDRRLPTAGGVQALRNFADVEKFAAVVYARPEYIATLATSTPASAHVTVDYQLQGCPIDRGQLLDTLAALLVGRKP
jgi:sulfhydrogenase subunit delta